MHGQQNIKNVDKTRFCSLSWLITKIVLRYWDARSAKHQNLWISRVLCRNENMADIKILVNILSSRNEIPCRCQPCTWLRDVTRANMASVRNDLTSMSVSQLGRQRNANVFCQFTSQPQYFLFSRHRFKLWIQKST